MVQQSFSRIFNLDYVLIDTCWLIVWLYWMLKKKHYDALLFAFVSALMIYYIDAIIWFNKSAGEGFEEGTKMREWTFILGNSTNHTNNETTVLKRDEEFDYFDIGNKYVQLKYVVDFMMLISYGMIYFSWEWAMFNIWFYEKNIRKILKYTSFLLIESFLIHPISVLLNNVSGITAIGVRHMHVEQNERENSVYKWYFYLLVSSMFIFNKTSFDLKQSVSHILFCFIIGCTQSFIMILPLYTFRIRTSTLKIFLYETVYLINQ
eukprot:312999_1